MKVCSSCQIEKPLSDFNKCKTKKFGVAAKCRECQKAYYKQYYENPDKKERVRSRVYKNKKIYRKKNREFVREYLSSHPCVDCGESDPIVLDFDHLRDKIGNVAQMKHNISPSMLLEEISKCEVRCGNCHRRKTAKQLGWYKGLI